MFAGEVKTSARWIKKPKFLVPPRMSERSDRLTDSAEASPGPRKTEGGTAFSNLYTQTLEPLPRASQPVKPLTSRCSDLSSASLVNSSRLSTKLSRKSSNGFLAQQFNLYLKSPESRDQKLFSKMTSLSAKVTETSGPQLITAGQNLGTRTGPKRLEVAFGPNMSNHFVRMGSSDTFSARSGTKQPDAPISGSALGSGRCIKSSRTCRFASPQKNEKSATSIGKQAAKKTPVLKQSKPVSVEEVQPSLHKLESTPAKLVKVGSLPAKGNESLKDLAVVHSGALLSKKETLSQKLANNKYLYAESMSLSKLNAVRCNLMLDKNTSTKKADRLQGPPNFEAPKTKHRSPLLKLKKAASRDFSSMSKTLVQSSNKVTNSKPSLGSRKQSKHMIEKPVVGTTDYFNGVDPAVQKHWAEGVDDFRKAQVLYKLIGRAARQGKKFKLGSQRKNTAFTILFDLDETLAHCSQSKSLTRLTLHTLETPKDDSLVTVYTRPHVASFLERLRVHFEVVLFTSASQKYAEALVSQFDPEGKLFDGRLYRENCMDVGGGIFIKDLGVILDRPLSRMLLVDNCLYSALNQPSNIIPIMPFTGDPNDIELLSLEKFLLQAKILKGDVRKWLASVANFKLA